MKLNKNYLLIMGLVIGLTGQAFAQNVPNPPVGLPPIVGGASDQVLNEQSQGMYPVMERSATLPLGALQQAWDLPYASSGQAAPGVMRFAWNPNFVMAIRTREFMVTTIHLPEWEQVSNIILGDPVVFEAQRVKTNILAVRPTHAGGDTNLTVVGGSGNVYSFYIRSEGWNSDQLSDLTVYVEANRPMKSGMDHSSVGEQLVTTPVNVAMGNVNTGNEFTPPEYLRQIAFRPENLQFNLKIYAPTADDAEIAPVRVFHDGIWTYFDFGNKADKILRPVLYHVVDGVDSLVNTRTVGPTNNILVAETTGSFTLRNGNRVICVRPTSAGAPEFFKAAGKSGFEIMPSSESQIMVIKDE